MAGSKTCSLRDMCKYSCFLMWFQPHGPQFFVRGKEIDEALNNQAY